ncbi:MAG TPA: PAS domain S-box protein, partial [Gammaproteobacteria bacterium]
MPQRLNLPQQLIRLISEPAFVIDHKAGIYAVNHAACDTLNFSCEELLQMHFAEIDHNLSEDDWHNNWQTYKEHETSSHSTLYNNARGEQIAVQVNQHFIHHNDQEYLCVI